MELPYRSLPGDCVIIMICISAGDVTDAGQRLCTQKLHLKIPEPSKGSRRNPAAGNKSDTQLGKINLQIVVDVHFDGITEGVENRTVIMLHVIDYDSFL